MAIDTREKRQAALQEGLVYPRGELAKDSRMETAWLYSQWGGDMPTPGVDVYGRVGEPIYVNVAPNTNMWD